MKLENTVLIMLFGFIRSFRSRIAIRRVRIRTDCCLIITTAQSIVPQGLPLRCLWTLVWSRGPPPTLFWIGPVPWSQPWDLRKDVEKFGVSVLVVGSIWLKRKCKCAKCCVGNFFARRRNVYPKMSLYPFHHGTLVLYKPLVLNILMRAQHELSVT